MLHRSIPAMVFATWPSKRILLFLQNFQSLKCVTHFWALLSRGSWWARRPLLDTKNRSIQNVCIGDTVIERSYRDTAHNLIVFSQTNVYLQSLKSHIKIINEASCPFFSRYALKPTIIKNAKCE